MQHQSGRLRDLAERAGPLPYSVLAVGTESPAHHRELTLWLASMAVLLSWFAAGYGVSGDFAVAWLLAPTAAICTVAAMLGAAIGEPS